MQLDKINIKNLIKDRVAQRQLYDFIYENLFHIPFRYKKTKHLAEEIFNDAMIKVFNSLKKIDEIDNVLAWSSKIIFNTTIDSLRKEVKFKERISYPEKLPDIESSVNDALNDLATEELFDCIQSLPQNQLAVFSLYEVDGYSHKEISSMLSISVSNSKYLLHAAKKELRIRVQTFHLS